MTRRPCIEELEEQARRLADRVESLRPLAEELDAVAAEFPGINAWPALHDGTHATIYITVHSDLEAHVAEVMRRLFRNGWRKDDEPRHMPENQAVIYSMRRPGSPTLSIYATLTGIPDEGSSRACRFVEVGKKEVPVFEVRCEEVS